VSPWADPYDETTDYTTARYLACLAAMFDEIADIVRDQDDGTPGWAVLFDPDTCPVLFLPWLGRLVGVNLGGGSLSEAQMREAIRERSGFKRGTPDAIRSAAIRHLTGNQYVALAERDTGPGHYTVTVRTSEVIDATALFADLLAQKPAGLTFALVQSDAVTIDEGTRTIDAATATIDAAVVADVT
jgi:P2-related tail formation protein